MRRVAFIPARGGSKSIKNKNIMTIAGKPLIWWTIIAASKADCIDKVFVSTDSSEIAKGVKDFNIPKVEVISRGAHTATDTATSESALIEFCETYDFDDVIFLQATSPLTSSLDIEQAFKKLETENFDSIISAVKRYQFIWDTNGTPINYNPQTRPRRQEWDGYYIENGAFYISSRERILKSQCRLSGNVGFYEMPQETIFEVDEPQDWKLIETFINNLKTFA